MRINVPIWTICFVYIDPPFATRRSFTIANGRAYTTVPIHAPGETAKGKSCRAFKGKLPPAGRHWRTDVETLELWDREGLIEWSANGNPRKIIYADERKEKRVQDIWEYKDPQYPCIRAIRPKKMQKCLI